MMYNIPPDLRQDRQEANQERVRVWAYGVLTFSVLFICSVVDSQVNDIELIYSLYFSFLSLPRKLKGVCVFLFFFCTVNSAMSVCEDESSLMSALSHSNQNQNQNPLY